MEKITSVNNSKIKELIKLKNNLSAIKETRTLLIEGFHLVDEALAHNLIKEIYILENKTGELTFKFDNVILISDNVAKKLSSTSTSQGIFALCELPNCDIDYTKNILLLDSLQDPGNLGTLIRSAAAFDFRSIVSSPTSVSFYNDKVIRSTQGNLFNLNLSTNVLIDQIRDLKNKGYLIIGTVISNNSTRLSSYNFENNLICLVIGNEGKGISDELKPLIDINLNIEMQENVESLNASIAGSIVMYEIYKKS